MNEEEQKKADTAKAEAEAKAKADKEKADAEANLSEEEREAKAKEEAEKAKQIDYEALLKEEKDKREKAEQALADKRFKESEERRKKQEEDGGDDKDKPLTESRLQEILAENRQATEKTLQEGTAIQIARANTSSEAEAQLAVLRWKDIRPSGNLESDVLFAIGGINSKKIIAQNAELKRALANRDNANKDATGDYREETPGVEPKLPGEDAKAYKQAGFTYDTTKKLYKRPLKGSKAFLYKDPKTKRTWAE